MLLAPSTNCPLIVDIAVDTVQAGPGDTVLVMDEGNGARQIRGLDPGAIRAVVVGVVDEVTVGGWAVDPLVCARCSQRMSIIAFVTDLPGRSAGQT